ncbi:rod shape-determining protein MreD [Histidinibacterium aquaticum]|uniref:Rod shape-determining protein MreD n=1 Tax=Histidinibacterium aquaticum TaxID=2613962 RepID=A0A5J5GPV6_9RHOB|nr:rod shape-determining protein MreD [Histidinibacterium aquaticum]KAA9010406.1 rod shape-determining protein MreD [Histidinibacterium aquaticum]
MAERAPLTRLWIGRGVYIALVALLIFLHLLPLDTLPSNWAPPDFILALTFAWAARRPDFVPVLLIAAVFLLTDLLYHRPPGLWTALVIVATEALRHRAQDLRAVPFPLEWATAAFAIVAVTLANRVVLGLTMTPQAPLSLTMIQMVLTVLAYPLVTGLSYLIFGVRRPAPGEVDALGHRL